MTARETNQNRACRAFERRGREDAGGCSMRLDGDHKILAIIILQLMDEQIRTGGLSEHHASVRKHTAAHSDLASGVAYHTFTGIRTAECLHHSRQILSSGAHLFPTFRICSLVRSLHLLLFFSLSPLFRASPCPPPRIYRHPIPVPPSLAKNGSLHLMFAPALLLSRSTQ